MPKALITGITGQDGSYLAQLLLAEEYRVAGIVRRSSTANFARIESFRPQLELHVGDLADQGSITRVLDCVQPDEIYNLACMSYVGASWQQPVLTGDLGGLRMQRGRSSFLLAGRKRTQLFFRAAICVGRPWACSCSRSWPFP